jgi:hypothetical protein
MEETITKFMRVMELRSASMFRFIKEFAEWYRKENHLHVELTEGSLTPNDYYIYNLHFQVYDDVSINEYDSAGRGHQLLRLVNSNLKKVIDILGNIMRYHTLNDDNQVKEKVRELANLLGIDVNDERKLLSPAFLHDLLSNASNMMKDPTKYFDAAGCYSISGLNGTNRYIDELRRNRLSLVDDNEFKIAKAFFEYVDRS